MCVGGSSSRLSKPYRTAEGRLTRMWGVFRPQERRALLANQVPTSSLPRVLSISAPGRALSSPPLLEDDTPPFLALPSPTGYSAEIDSNVTAPPASPEHDCGDEYKSLPWRYTPEGDWATVLCGADRARPGVTAALAALVKVRSSQRMLDPPRLFTATRNVRSPPRRDFSSPQSTELACLRSTLQLAHYTTTSQFGVSEPWPLGASLLSSSGAAYVPLWLVVLLLVETALDVTIGRLSCTMAILLGHVILVRAVAYLAY